MIVLAALLSAVSSTVLSAIALAFAFGGLSPATANAALGIGVAVAVLVLRGAWSVERGASVEPRREGAPRFPLHASRAAAITLFTLFSLRAFLSLVFWDGDEIKVLSPNNLGDLSLHLTYIHQLAGGAPFWPENPIVPGAKLTYPLGVDLFHALLLLAGADVFRTFLWLGLAGSALLGIALWRWGGAWTLAGFLCNGGLAGFAFFATWRLEDFQSELAWKSLPLALWVTQRGLLWALPAGLLLLCSWRARFFGADRRGRQGTTAFPDRLPRFVEVLLYAAMPVFHLHTFLFLSLLLLAWFIVHPRLRWTLAALVGQAFLPATLLTLFVTDFGRGPSVLGWHPGWMQDQPEFLAWCAEKLGTESPLITIPVFWIWNFGALPLFVAALLIVLCRKGKSRDSDGESRVWARAVVLPALGVFALCCFVKFAPWEWDNTKLMLWSYIAVLPFLWTHLLARKPAWMQACAAVALFGSGFLSLLGGLDGSHRGFAIATRSELDPLDRALRLAPERRRFITHPDYNHPVLLLGRSVALGYTGHVWSHGYRWEEPLARVTAVLEGEPGWRETARGLGARYLFWGAPERTAYPDSPQPWRTETRLIAAGEWGEIWDLEAAPDER